MRFRDRRACRPVPAWSERWTAARRRTRKRCAVCSPKASESESPIFVRGAFPREELDERSKFGGSWKESARYSRAMQLLHKPRARTSSYLRDQVRRSVEVHAVVIPQIRQIQVVNLVLDVSVLERHAEHDRKPIIRARVEHIVRVRAELGTQDSLLELHEVPPDAHEV
eukprot:scaffold1876_cov257-Pinguiococcus_pyrenoidosus.AAC.9